VTERNPYHKPAGTSAGGEFTTRQLGIIENAARDAAGVSNLGSKKKFVSSGYQSTGIEYSYRQVLEDVEEKKFIVFYNNEEIGEIHQYSAYKDSKPSGQRYASSRKNITLWAATIKEGFHAKRWGYGVPGIMSGSATEMGFVSINKALQQIANMHKR